MKIFLSFAAALLAAGLSTGCQSPGAQVPVNSTKHGDETFILMDSGAQHSVMSSGIEANRLPDGRLEVAANVRNRENRRIQVQINCEFMDAHGFAVHSTPWQTLILTENGQETVRFASLNNQASKYTVRVREAR